MQAVAPYSSWREPCHHLTWASAGVQVAVREAEEGDASSYGSQPYVMGQYIFPTQAHQANMGRSLTLVSTKANSIRSIHMTCLNFCFFEQEVV